MAHLTPQQNEDLATLLRTETYSVNMPLGSGPAVANTCSVILSRMPHCGEFQFAPTSHKWLVRWNNWHDGSEAPSTGETPEDAITALLESEKQC